MKGKENDYWWLLNRTKVHSTRLFGMPVRILFPSIILFVGIFFLASCSAAQPAKTGADNSAAQALSANNAAGAAVFSKSKSAPDGQPNQAALEPASPEQKAASTQALEATVGPIEAPVEAAQAAAGPLPAEGTSVGLLAPDFTLNTLDGQAVKLSDLRGKHVLVNFWVTWCIPCKEELPALQTLYQDYKDKDLVILSVDGIGKDKLDNVKTWVQQDSLTYPILLDENDKVYNNYQVKFYPTTFFIDSQGIIRSITLGSNTEEEFRTKIEKLISGNL